MTRERGFLAELMHRRVPQILGLYIAGVWLGVEIGNWLGEQFPVPERLTAYIFVFCAALLPSIAVIAWTHGAPGKEVRTRFEKAFVPLNLALAAACVWLVPAPGADVAPVAPVAQAAELPAPEPVESAEAPTEVMERSVRVFAFAFANKTADGPDWVSYAVPQLVTEDLVRASPAFVVAPILDAERTIESLRRMGYPRASGEGATVQADLALRSNYRYFLRGEVADDANGDGFLIRYSLRKSESLEEVLSGEEAFAAGTLIAAADRVSGEVQETLAALFEDGLVRRNSTLAETFTDSEPALHALVDARVAQHIDFDQEAVLVNLRRAVELDPRFAEAHGVLALRLYLSGQTEPALAAANEALRSEFRLSPNSVFYLKINRFAMQRDFAGALRVARTWASVQPDSEAAHRALASLVMTAAQDLEDGLAALERVREIVPSDVSTLLESADIERQRGNLDAAEQFVRRYIEAQPNVAHARVELAEILVERGNFDAAQEEYERASVLESNSIVAELGSISVLMRQGKYALAEDRLQSLRSASLTDEQQMEVLFTTTSMYTLLGQYDLAAAEMEATEEIARRVLPPLLYTVQFDAPRVVLRGFVTDEPNSIIATLDEMRAVADPPWNDFLHWYDMTVYSITGDADAYSASLARAERFLARDGSDNLRMMLHTAYAQDAVFQDDPGRAIENIERALELSESSLLNVVAASEVFGIRVNMYDLMRRAGRPDRAIEGLVEVVTRFPGHALGHLRLAQAYFEIGKRSEAQRALDAALDIWRDADETLVFLREADDLRERLATAGA